MDIEYCPVPYEKLDRGRRVSLEGGESMEESKTGLSRRSFLKSAAVAGAATVGATALTACASGSEASSGATASGDWLPESWEIGRASCRERV